MKTLLQKSKQTTAFIFALCLTLAVAFAQAPKRFNFQMVIRNSSGVLLPAGSSIGAQISILQGSATGAEKYRELQNVTTNANGLASFEIGGGTWTAGDFNTIDWASDTFWIKTEIDPTGGTSYTITGTSQLLSVPYALNAKTADVATTLAGGIPTSWSQNGNDISNSNSGNVGIGTSTPSSKLHISGVASQLRIDETNVNSSIFLAAPSSTATGGVGTTGNFDLKLFAGGTDRVTVKPNGNVGVGTLSPTEKLEVAGKVKSLSLQVTTGAAAGSVLQSDASGNASWVAPTSLAITETDPQVGTITTNYVPKWNGSSLSNGVIFDNGKVGIGTTSPADLLQIGDYSSNQDNYISIKTSGGNAHKCGIKLRNYADNDGFTIECDEIVNQLKFMNANGTTNMVIDRGTGYVGIGTTTPHFPLEVGGQASGPPCNVQSYETWFTPGSALQTSSAGITTNVSIYAPHYIASGYGILAHSDVRIKNIIGITNSASDLQTLRAIQITDYTMRDKTENKQLFKKVIAQQVQEVYPQAVSNCSDVKFIANLYQLVESYKIDGNTITIILDKAIEEKDKNDIVEGADFKFYLSEKAGEKKMKEMEGTIAVINGNTITVTVSEQPEAGKYDKLFAYGTKVSNLLTVDYEAISMLNVSATQELSKKVEALEKENTSLKTSLDAMQQQMQTLSAKVNALDKSTLTGQVITK